MTERELASMDAALSNLDPYIMFLNARRICRREYARRPNWSLAMDVFGLGSTYAFALCRRMGVDPDGKSASRVFEVIHD